MAKRKAGLQKKISSIFDGVPIPTKKEQEQPVSAASEQVSYPAPKAPPPTGAPTSARCVLDQVAPPKVDQPQKSYVKSEKPKERPPQRTEAPPALKSKIVIPKFDDENRKQKKLMVLVGVLIVIFVVIFGRKIIPDKNTPHPTDAPPGQLDIITTAALAANVKIDWEKPVPFPELPRDPMASIVLKVEPPDNVKPPENTTQLGELVVKGIVFSDDRRAALIGEQMVYEGEIISGRTVLKINRKSVEFEMNGKRWIQQVQRSKTIEIIKELN